jgi:transaldolase
MFIPGSDEADAKKIELIDSLMHKAAIDNTRLIYSDFKSIFHGDEFAELAELGAAVQRPLWGSTSMKNPDLPDTMYVEDLVGSQTVNTIPAATLDALLDHGQVRAATLDRDLEGASARVEQLRSLGIDVEKVCDELQVAGVKSFADAFDTLFDSITKALA